ncbi:MAG: amino acid transporter [Proteobacteria bacterium]|nr:amino acid transporter [Pseudomonadota bacterium]MCH8322040.1 amino acid transporter [Pseudomonadota bacterium]
MESTWAALYAGFLISLGLILAIGPQNAYVIRKGLKKRHVFLVTTLCFLSDALLIALGAAGVGALLQDGGILSLVITGAGVLFLFWYGAKSFKDAFHPTTMTKEDIKEAGKQAQGKGWGIVVLTVLAFTYLNPHVYIDTLVILGGLSAQYEMPARLYFVAGAIIGSAVWFYGIGYGAGFFSKTFENPKAWRILDIFVGIIMWGAAGYLAFEQFKVLS